MAIVSIWRNLALIPSLAKGVKLYLNCKKVMVLPVVKLIPFICKGNPLKKSYIGGFKI